MIMTFTVRATIKRVARILADRGVVPVSLDPVGDKACCVAIPEVNASAMITVLSENRVSVEANKPHVLYSDPTFVQAAQRIELRERKS